MYFIHLLKFCLLPSTFQVKPSKGLLQDKYQLLVVKTTPKQENVKLRHQLQCLFNDNSKHIRNIELLGSSEQPNILLDSEVSLLQNIRDDTLNLHLLYPLSVRK